MKDIVPTFEKRFVTAWNAGVTVADLVTRFGGNHATIIAHAKRLGLTMRGSGGKSVIYKEPSHA